ncbi:MAG TPA: hypothetical protein VI588_02310 [Candidatus Gracilibacteria bacterium]|nr:hypothetical protein [Candidatus Gracilibacteria bacterium]
MRTIQDILITRDPIDEDDGTACIYISPDGKIHRVFGVLPRGGLESLPEEKKYRKIRAVQRLIQGRCCSLFLDPEDRSFDE